MRELKDIVRDAMIANRFKSDGYFDMNTRQWVHKIPERGIHVGSEGGQENNSDADSENSS